MLSRSESGKKMPYWLPMRRRTTPLRTAIVSCSLSLILIWVSIGISNTSPSENSTKMPERLRFNGLTEHTLSPNVMEAETPLEIESGKRMTRGRCGSLHLHRMELSSTTPHRFSPALSHNIWCDRLKS